MYANLLKSQIEPSILHDNIYNSLNFLRPFTDTMDKPMKIIHIS